MKRLALFLFACSLAWAGHPEAFATLGGELEAELATLKLLERMPWTGGGVDAYAEAQRSCFDKGYALDAALPARSHDSGALRTDYLACLRTLQRQSERWRHAYASALQQAMESGNVGDFERLVTHPLEPLRRPSLQEQALAFYGTVRAEHAIPAMETLRERSANTVYAADDEAFEQEQTVLGFAAARRSDRPVVVSTKEHDDRFIFYAKNRNDFPVTLTLSVTQMKNFKASAALPFSTELAPNAETKLLTVDVVERGKGASMLPRYTWVMGRASARHSDPLYRLPFAVGSEAMVSQGFNGGITHVGRSCYAVDFSCPVGTKIYAARGGRVVAVETRHKQGGFEARFRAEANYIIIEHDDHTLGKYVHLKHYGSLVQIGETVRTGQLIGYSGNTGYSSGPHLHFSVSSVDPDSKSVPVTLPFRFQTAEGEVDAPRSREVYRVVKVR